MEENYLDEFQQQQDLVNDFISNNNIKSFRKMLSSSRKPKEQKNHSPIKSEILNTPKVLKKLKLKNETKNYPIDLFNKIHSNISNDSINNNNLCYEHNRYNFLYDDEECHGYKMKGNYKWGKQNFKLLKYNWAKRKGLRIDQYHLPKFNYWERNPLQQIDGNILYEHGHLLSCPAHKMDRKIVPRKNYQMNQNNSESDYDTSNVNINVSINTTMKLPPIKANKFSFIE